jgi:hypothetical protein
MTGLPFITSVTFVVLSGQGQSHSVRNTNVVTVCTNLEATSWNISACSWLTGIRDVPNSNLDRVCAHRNIHFIRYPQSLHTDVWIAPSTLKEIRNFCKILNDSSFVKGPSFTDELHVCSWNRAGAVKPTRNDCRQQHVELRSALSCLSCTLLLPDTYLQIAGYVLTCLNTEPNVPFRHKIGTTQKDHFASLQVSRLM